MFKYQDFLNSHSLLNLKQQLHRVTHYLQGDIDYSLLDFFVQLIPKVWYFRLKYCLFQFVIAYLEEDLNQSASIANLFFPYPVCREVMNP